MPGLATLEVTDLSQISMYGLVKHFISAAHQAPMILHFMFFLRWLTVTILESIVEVTSKLNNNHFRRFAVLQFLENNT